MSDIIQEISNSIAKDFIMEHKSSINNDAPLTHECVQYAIERIFAMPLSSRLTDEEKEKIRLYYGLARDGYWECNCANKAVVRVLESIFGKELFVEEE